ncbi:MAG: NUDIX domain-containing protein [Candidatus Sabulitectum sp.]|nr:NUDIX domain-containing protein [Candidatus Sabulitectum sp.]
MNFESTPCGESWVKERFKESKMIRYVAGLLFDDDMERVALIHKERGPECVVGKWNALGGKFEPGESSIPALIREFEEEGGVKIPADLLKEYCVITGEEGSFMVYFYYACSTELLEQVKTCEDEEVLIWRIKSLPDNLAPHMTWMIPFLKDNLTENFIRSIITSRYAGPLK